MTLESASVIPMGSAPEPIQRKTIRPVSVVALVGPAQVGKTTVAQELQTRYGYSRFRFADTLKKMIEVLGVSRDHIDGSKKEHSLELLCGQTTRHAMQTLGTEWRNMIGVDLWAVQTSQRIAELAEKQAGKSGRLMVVIDDCRFPHELSALTDAGYDVTVIRVWNSTKDYRYARMWLSRRKWGRLLMKVLPFLYLHESEAWWPYFDADYEIDNRGSLNDLYEDVLGITRALSSSEATEHFHVKRSRPAVGAVQRSST